MTDRLRLAVVSTPRSGNCWLRHMLNQMLELEEIIVHLPTEVSWDALPARAILQLHWMPDDGFVSLLAQHEFRVVVLARHPLDVLVSILAFSQHDDSTLRWLAGAGGDERPIAGASPMSAAFAEYAVGPRAKALLGVSVAWWRRSGVCRVRYEDLVSDPTGQLQGILAALGEAPRKSPSDVAAKATPELVRAQNVHMLFHVWQAQRSLWRQFLPAPAARTICEAHRRVLETLGYACDPDESLAPAAAEAAWSRFDAEAVKRHLHGLKRVVCDIQAHHHHAHCAQQREIERQRGEIAGLARQLDELRLQQAAVAGLGPWSLGAARTLNRWSGRFPRAAGSVKTLVTLWRSTLARVGRSVASK
jgi:hypothetical protein